MAIKSSSSKGLSKPNLVSHKLTTKKDIKKTQTFNQKYDNSNDILVQSIKTVMNDKRRICEREKSAFSLSTFSYALSSRSGLTPNSTNQQVLYNTMTNDLGSCFGPTYRDIKLAFIDENSNNKVIDKTFQFNIDHKLMCLICHKLMSDPCKCYKCSTCYCRKCIEKVIIKTTKCPQCFNMIGTTSLIPVDMTTIYSSTVIPCPIPGCKDSFNLLEIKKHMSECPFQEAKETQRVNVHKILPSPSKEDSYIKLHLLSYLRKINSTEIDLAESYVLTQDENKKMESSLNEPKHEKDYKEKNDLLTLKININHFNNVLEKNLIDISNATKKTNDNIKSMLNHLPKCA